MSFTDEKIIKIASIANRQMTIHEMRSLISDAEAKGATHIKYWWSGDPRYPYEWVDFISYKSDEQIKSEKIEKLEKEIENLKRL